MHNIRFRTAVAAAGALVLAASLTGCATTQPEAAATNAPLTGTASNCKPLPQPTINPDTPTIAILGAQGAALEPYSQDTGLIISTAKTTKARVIVNGISDGPDAPNLLSNVVLDGQGNNNLARTTDLNCKAARVNEAIDTLKKGQATKAPDVFDAMNALAGNLAHNPSTQPVDVVLLAPLTAHGGGTDLADPKTLTDPVGAINSLAAKGLIPHCENWRIYAVSPSPGLDDVMAARLKDFWTRYAQKCGGTLVAWEDHLATFPVQGALAPADTSQIKVERTGADITGTLGGDVLFAAEGHTLLDSAAPALNNLLDLATKHAGPVVITGYVNPTGPTAYDRVDLSRQRAKAVKDWLTAHGIEGSRITVTGKGGEDAVYPNPTSEAQAAANRRVVVVIHTQT
ncbi:OmpA family protein [Sinomonas soli]